MKWYWKGKNFEKWLWESFFYKGLIDSLIFLVVQFCLSFDECNATDLLSKYSRILQEIFTGIFYPNWYIVNSHNNMYDISLHYPPKISWPIMNRKNKRNLKEKTWLGHRTQQNKCIYYTFAKQTFLGQPRVRGSPSGSAAATWGALSLKMLMESCLEPIWRQKRA